MNEYAEIAKTGAAVSKAFGDAVAGAIPLITRVFEQMAEDFRRERQERFDEQRQLVAALDAAPWYSRIRGRWALGKAPRWAK